MKFETVVIVAAVLMTFGAVIDDHFMVADDYIRTGLMNDVVAARPNLGSQLYGVFFKAEGKGHYKPVQDVFFHLARHFFGEFGWSKAMMLAYMALHAASGLLLAAILRRLGAPRAPALLGALLFVVHPVYDENLAAPQFANNVPATTFMLGVVLACIAREKRLFLRMILAGLAAFCAVGYGPNMACTLALLGGAVSLLNLQQTRRWKAALIPLGVVALGVGLALVLRMSAYGALGSKHGNYKTLKPVHRPVQFTQRFLTGSLLLEASGEATGLAGISNLDGRMFDEKFERPLLSLETAIVLAIAAGLAAAVAFAGRGGVDAGKSPSSRWIWKGAFLGLAIAFSAVLPYYIWLGRISPNRYSYPGTSGMVLFVTAAVGLLALGLARLLRRRPAPVLAALLFLLALPMISLSRESARSIEEGHRISRRVWETVVAELQANPEATFLYPMGWPNVVGRSGFSITANLHVAWLLQKSMDRKFEQWNLGPIFDVQTKRLREPFDERTLFLVASPDGSTIQRVEARTLADLGEPAERWELRRLLGKPPPQVLASPFRSETELYLRKGVDRRINGLGFTSRTLVSLLMPQPVKKLKPRFGLGIAHLDVMAKAFEKVAELRRWDVGLAAIAASSIDGSQPDLDRALLRVAAEAKKAQRLEIAINVAYRNPAGSALETEALRVADPTGKHGEALRQAVAAERELRSWLLAPELRPETLDRLKACRRAYGACGVPRPHLGVLIARVFAAKIPLEDCDAEGKKQRAAKRGFLASEISRRKRLAKEVPRVQLDFRPRVTSFAKGKTGSWVLIVRNQWVTALPGIGGSLGTGVLWEVLDEDGRTSLIAGIEELGLDVLPPGKSVRLPIRTALPDESGKYLFRARLVVAGKLVKTQQAKFDLR